jgi:hypothetical protein
MFGDFSQPASQRPVPELPLPEFQRKATAPVRQWVSSIQS